MTGSKIVVCNDLTFAQNRVLETLDAPIVKTFFHDEFKVEHTAAVIKEAYIAEEVQKAIVLSASAYNVYAQNALLKLLEEPPRNIVFILISRSKNGLLPTIRSRMQLEVLQVPKEPIDLGVDIGRLDLESMFTMIQQHRNAKKEELKSIIAALLEESVVKNGIRLKEKELESFDMTLELAELNSRADAILSLLLLEIYEAKMRRS